MLTNGNEDSQDDPLHTTLLLHADGDENKTDTIRLSNMKLLSFTVRKSLQNSSPKSDPPSPNRSDMKNSSFPTSSSMSSSLSTDDELLSPSFSISITPDSTLTSTSPTTTNPNNIPNLPPPSSPLRKFNTSLSPVIEEELDLNRSSSLSENTNPPKGDITLPRSSNPQISPVISPRKTRFSFLPDDRETHEIQTKNSPMPPLEHVPNLGDESPNVISIEGEGEEVEPEISETSESNKVLFNPFTIYHF